MYSNRARFDERHFVPEYLLKSVAPSAVVASTSGVVDRAAAKLIEKVSCINLRDRYRRIFETGRTELAFWITAKSGQPLSLKLLGEELKVNAQDVFLIYPAQHMTGKCPRSLSYENCAAASPMKFMAGHFGFSMNASTSLTACSRALGLLSVVM